MKWWWETIILALNPRTRTASISAMIYSVATRHQDSATSSCMWEQRQNSVFFPAAEAKLGWCATLQSVGECVRVCLCVHQVQRSCKEYAGQGFATTSTTTNKPKAKFDRWMESRTQLLLFQLSTVMEARRRRRRRRAKQQTSIHLWEKIKTRAHHFVRHIFGVKNRKTHDFDDSSSARKHLANTRTEGNRKEEKRDFLAWHWAENGEKRRWNWTINQSVTRGFFFNFVTSQNCLRYTGPSPITSYDGTLIYMFIICVSFWVI
jgi:hypothetical protein